MIESLRIINFPSGSDITVHKEQLEDAFVLNTCQRAMIVFFHKNPEQDIEYLASQSIKGEDAYTFLLKVICGLKSQLLGENEIVNQFKLAYKDYANNKSRCTKTLTILEKLFKDAKEVRTNYLIGLGQKTYSSITRKKIYNAHRPQKVLILGSGQLAEDLINQFKKKTEVYISARNQQRLNELCHKHDIQVIPWKDFEQYGDFAFIANSIGCSHGAFIGQDFFDIWKSANTKRLFIDLGSPSVIDTHFSINNGVMRLRDIFKEGAVEEEHKQKQLDKALGAVKEIVNKRKSCLNQKSQKQKIYARNN